MPRARKKGRLSSKSDDNYTPSASARRSSITMMPRHQRERRAPTAFSPKVDAVMRKPRKPKDLGLESVGQGGWPSVTTSSRPEHKRLENKIKSQAHRLRYPLAFIEAYEADGWNKSSRDKLKPSKELEMERCKIVKGQWALIEGLRALMALYAEEPQVPPMAVFEDVHCSRCGSTDIAQDNDILLCDSPGCHRAYHQQCQTPIVLTSEIPEGDNSWFCEVCLAIFECLKSINSVFGTTYESVDDLFPDLRRTKQHVGIEKSDMAPRDAARAAAPVAVDDDEEDDEDFVCCEGDEGDEDEDDDEDEDEDEQDEHSIQGGVGEEETMAENVPESAQDLIYLSKDNVIDLNHRSSRSKSANRQVEPVCKKKSLIGEIVAKINRKTGDIVLGIVAELEPPAEGRYSRWRIDYRDGTFELLTRSKVQAAMKLATIEYCGDEGAEVGIVRSKRKRNEVDYRLLNELMFAGKDEDSEDDETFEVKDDSDEEPDEEGDNTNENDNEELTAKGAKELIQRVPGDASPTTVTASHDAVPQHTCAKRSQRSRRRVDYYSMHEGLLS